MSQDRGHGARHRRYLGLVRVPSKPENVASPSQNDHDLGDRVPPPRRIVNSLPPPGRLDRSGDTGLVVRLQEEATQRELDAKAAQMGQEEAARQLELARAELATLKQEVEARREAEEATEREKAAEKKRQHEEDEKVHQLMLLADERRRNLKVASEESAAADEALAATLKAKEAAEEARKAIARARGGILPLPSPVLPPTSPLPAENVADLELRPPVDLPTEVHVPDFVTSDKPTFVETPKALPADTTPEIKHRPPEFIEPKALPADTTPEIKHRPPVTSSCAVSPKHVEDDLGVPEDPPSFVTKPVGKNTDSKPIDAAGINEIGNEVEGSYRAPTASTPPRTKRAKSRGEKFMTVATKVWVWSVPRIRRFTVSAKKNPVHVFTVMAVVVIVALAMAPDNRPSLMSNAEAEQLCRPAAWLYPEPFTIVVTNSNKLCQSVSMNAGIVAVDRGRPYNLFAKSPSGFSRQSILYALVRMGSGGAKSYFNPNAEAKRVNAMQSNSKSDPDFLIREVGLVPLSGSRIKEVADKVGLSSDQLEKYKSPAGTPIPDEEASMLMAARVINESYATLANDEKLRNELNGSVVNGKAIPGTACNAPGIANVDLGSGVSLCQLLKHVLRDTGRTAPAYIQKATQCVADWVKPESSCTAKAK